jgi:hypothetical protein
MAIRLVDHMGVLEQLDVWKGEAAKGPGGRPVTFSYRALLVALVACAITHQPLHLSQVCDVMFRQCNSKYRAVLDIPDPPAHHDDLGWAARYRNVRTRFADLIDLMDPSDTPKNRRLDPEAFLSLVEQRRAERSDGDRAVRHGRLEWFINRILQASLDLVPDDITKQWGGWVGVDATLVTSHARPPRQTRRAKSSDAPIFVKHSADPDAAWYARRGDHRSDDGNEPGGPTKEKFAWGFEATLAISGPDDAAEPSRFPNLAVGMAVLDKPGHNVGENGVRALAQVRERGYPAGLVAADRAYSNSRPDSFQLPARALDYGLILDYKSDQLGVKAEAQGFLQIEGAWYCPAIPQTLIDATIDFREHRIDEATYQARLQERWKHRARPKSKPDVEGHIRLGCPAAGPSPLVRCDLKPASIRPETRGRVRIALKSDLKTTPPPSCSQQSVTIAPGAGAKFDQDLLYGSPEWQAAYATLRNTNEGYHGYVKDGSREALADPGSRRLHGVAPQSVLTALCLMAANVRKIRTFLELKVSELLDPGRRRPRRRRTTPLQHWRPEGPTTATPSTSDPPWTP